MLTQELSTTMVLEELIAHRTVVQSMIDNASGDIDYACALIKQTITGGGKVLLAGNGGSAADAQHIAAELTGRFVAERQPLPAIALTTDTSALTAIANDYGYDQVFARQLKALAKTDDLFIAISTSGNSVSILNAISDDKEIGCKVLGLTGKDGGKMAGCCDLNIVVPSEITARIQEMHILIGHILCKAVDELFEAR